MQALVTSPKLSSPPLFMPPTCLEALSLPWHKLGKVLRLWNPKWMHGNTINTALILWLSTKNFEHYSQFIWPLWKSPRHLLHPVHLSEDQADSSEDFLKKIQREGTLPKTNGNLKFIPDSKKIENIHLTAPIWCSSCSFFRDLLNSCHRQCRGCRGALSQKKQAFESNLPPRSRSFLATKIPQFMGHSS